MAEGAEELLLDEGTNKSNKERERERMGGALLLKKVPELDPSYLG